MGGLTAPPAMADQGMLSAAPTPTGGQAATPVAPAPPPPEATMLFDAVTSITRAIDVIKPRIPEAAPAIQQILDAVDQLQSLIIKNMPPVEPAAPPI